ncbi:MAG: hypothetical protein K0R40_1560 [Burkholderiales bacterium]|jgi:hypothetical protein|nr:hypothetical protein [Burkholderiales bacterium]
MAGWLIPALKAVLPHVGDIVAAAKPVFTKKKPEAGAPGGEAQQIAELQAAVSQNAEHVRELAAQLQSTVTAIEKGAEIAELRLRRAVLFCAVAVALSLFALGVAVIGLLR